MHELRDEVRGKLPKIGRATVRAFLVFVCLLSLVPPLVRGVTLVLLCCWSLSFVSAMASTPSNGDGDTDLSFEALTFGEDSGHVKKENKVGKKKSFKKDRSNAPQVCTWVNKSGSEECWRKGSVVEEV